MYSVNNGHNHEWARVKMGGVGGTLPKEIALVFYLGVQVFV